MPERSAEQIAAELLNADVAEAKNNLRHRALEFFKGRGGSDVFVDAFENLIGKVIMRWWFARIVKNKAAVSKVDQKALEERRKVRALTTIASCQIINGKTNKGAPPDALQLQMAILDLTANNNAIWQALIDAAIITPDVKQDYLDGGVAELYGRVTDYAGKIDLTKVAAGRH